MRRLIIADHPGVPKPIKDTLAARGEVDVVNLPFWEDSCLSRAMRLHGLTEVEKAAAVAHADRLMHLLRDALVTTEADEVRWEYFRQALETHAVTPLAEGIALASAAAVRFRPEEIVAVVDPRSRDFWSGQAVAPHAAEAAARAMAASSRTVAAWRGRLSLAGSALATVARFLRWPAAVAHAARVFARARRIVGASPARPGPADVLLLAGGPVVEGLARKLAERLTDRGLETYLLTDPLLSRGSIRDGFAAMGAEALARGRGPAVARALGARGRAARAMARLAGKLDAVERRALWPRLMNLEARERPVVEWLQADAEAVLDAVKPAVVVAFHFYPRHATPYLVEARRRGLPTLCCQHGLMAPLDYPVVWYDRFCVFNEYSAELVAAVAPESARIDVVGNPALDGLVANPPQPWRPPGAGQRPVVVVATQPNDPPGVDRRPGWWFRAVARAAARCGAYVAVKLHPDQPAAAFGDMYAHALDQAGADGEVIEHGRVPLGSLIAGGDVFISQFSSTILEAMVLRRPVVFVEMRDGPPFYPFDDFGAARRVTTPGDAEAALREALREGQAEPPAEFVRRHLEPLDGRALERIAEVVAQLAGRPDRGGAS